jgi:raffinose/stachyose/melibiose transport system substrate-binding protein
MTRRGLRFLSVIIFLGMATALFAAGQGEKVALKFFTGKTETVDWMNALIERFQKDNPGITVEQEFQKDASNVIKVKLAAGDYPDITTVYTPQYAEQGLYLDLSGESAWWSRIQPGIKGKCTDVKSGKQYRVATNMTMAGLYYNKKIFADLGLKEASTWKDFMGNLTAVKNAGITPLFMGGKESWMLGHLIEFMAHGVIKQNLGDLESRRAFLNNDASKLNFDAAGGPMDSFARRFLELRDAGLLNSDLVTATYDNQLEAFASGKAAMISQGMWALSGILERNPGMKGNIGFSPYPPIVEGTKPVILSAEDSAYLVMAKSAHPGQAKDFLGYLFKADNQKSYSELLKSPSSFTDVDADWGPLKDEVKSALAKGVNIGFTTEAPAGFSGDDAGRMVQDLFVGTYATSMDFAKAYRKAWDAAAGAK